jgi:hypothetical protein
MHPDFTYELVETVRGCLILAAELRAAALERLQAWKAEVLGACQGAALGSLVKFRHPFYDRASPVYLGEYVTLDAGTGIVHSAPAYGLEDFDSCRKHGMHNDEILTPVQGDGVFASSLPFFGGMFVWKANAAIIEKLAEVGALFASSEIVHSYMHCWRHKTPIIYRATTQWFVGMDRVVAHPIHTTANKGQSPRPPFRERGRWSRVACGDAKRASDPARQGAGRGRGDEVLSRLGQGAPARDDCQPARLVRFAPAQLGRAYPLLPAQGKRRAASAHA